MNKGLVEHCRRRQTGPVDTCFSRRTEGGAMWIARMSPLLASFFLFLLSLAYPVVPATASVVDAPHNESNSIHCGSCHAYSLWWQYSPFLGTAAAPALTDAICTQCHGSAGPAFVKAGHSTASMDAPHPLAGSWSTSCVDCHDPHLQQQVKWLPANPVFNDGTLADGFFLVEGRATAITDHGDGTTTVTFTEGLAKPGWEDAEAWTMKSGHAGRGLILSLGYGQVEHTYEVIAASVDSGTQILPTTLPATGSGTITVQSGDAPLPTAYTETPFGLFYGQLVRDVIDTPHSGLRSVKFFDGQEDLVHTQTTPRDGVCQVCHTLTSYWRNDGDSDPSSEQHNPAIVCTACHHSETGFKPSGGPHTFLSESPFCMGCHPSGDILALHKNDCQHCHTSPPTLADPADKPLVLAIVQGSCQDCHGESAHPSEPTHNHRLTASFCAGCHAASSADAVDTLHGGDCLTCHAYGGSKLLPATVAAVIATGKGAVGSNVTCQSCHDDKGAAHHLRADATSGNCTACHTDPRPSRSGAAPGDNGGASAYPTQLACRQCHVRFSGTTLYVDKLAYDININQGAITRTVQHTLTGISSGAIENYGMCLSCHDGDTATKVRVHHAKPPYHFDSQAMMHDGGAPGRRSLNFFYSSLRNPVIEEFRIPYVKYVSSSANRHIRDSTMNPMISYKSIAIPCDSQVNGCTTGQPSVSVPVLPALHVAPELYIDSIWPTRGKPGIPVTLVGTFTATSAPTVYIGQTSAPATDWTPTTVTFTMPGGNSWVYPYGVMVKADANNSNRVWFTIENIDDADLDGVADASDQCPNTPSLQAVDYNGCAQSQFNNVLALSAATYSINENNPTGLVTITVSRSGSDYGPVTVNYATTAEGTAIPGSDYTPAAGTLQWDDGDLTDKSFTIAIINNQEYTAANKTVSLAITAPTGNLAVLGTPSTAVVTIVNDDPDPPSAVVFSPASYTIDENGGTAVIHVSRTGGSSNTAFAVSYTMQEGTAHMNEEFIFSSGTLQWEANDLTDKTISIPIIDNDVYYPMDKYLHIILSTPTNGAVLGDDGAYHSTLWALLTIIDDDLPATIAFAAPTYTVNEDAGTATITLRRTGISTGEVYAFGETQLDQLAYEYTWFTIIWPAGDMTDKSFTVPINNDSVYAADKVIDLTLYYASNAVLGSPSSATLTIVNDDPPTVAFSAASYSSSEASGLATITVSRVGASPGPVSVDFTTTNTGTAAAGDYTATSGTLTWSDGDMTDKSFTVAISDNTTYEGDKTVGLALANATGDAMLLGSPDTALLTIVEDDTALAFTAPTYSVSENGALATISVSRLGSASGAVGVNYATTTGGTAQAGDYTATAGPLSWADGDMTTKTFTVAISDNSEATGDRTVTLALDTATGGALLQAGGDTAELTIVEDETLFVFAAASYSASESAGTATITVKRLGNHSAASVVTYALMADAGTAQAGNSPVAGVDYQFVSATPPYGWLQWAPGETADKSFAVTLYDDALVEGDETVNLELLLPGPPPAGTDLGAPSTTTLTIVDDE